MAHTIEAELSPGIWTDISTDVLLREGVFWEREISGDGPTDVLAGPGSMRFALNNKSSNSGGLAGYYTPGHANVRAGFGLGTRVRLRLVEGAASWYHFLGELKTILPTPGSTGEAPSFCEAVNWFNQFAETRDLRLVLRENYRSDQGISDLVGQVAVAPANQILDVGLDVYAFMFDDVGPNTPAPAIAQDICQSERGYLYVRGDQTDGETLRFENRLARAVASVKETFLEGELVGITVPSDQSRMVNIVDVAAFPRSVGTTNVVLVSLDSEVTVHAGETEKIFVDLRDPDNQAEFVGGKNMVAPVSPTDWTANDTSGGGGADVSSDFAVVLTPWGSRALIAITNNGTATGHLRGPAGADGMQARGLMLARYAPVVRHGENTTSISAHGERPMGRVIDMPYQGDVRVAQDSADFVANLWGGVVNIPTFVSPVTSRPGVLERCISVDIGDKIVASESMTAVAGAELFIHGVAGEILANRSTGLTYRVAPADTTAVLILDDAVAGKLDANALGFG